MPAGDVPLGFSKLATQRIGASRNRAEERTPRRSAVIVMVYDLLKDTGRDIRALPLTERRARLAARLAPIPATLPIRLSAPVAAADWTAHGRGPAAIPSRDLGAEGLMLKRLDAPYLAGRKKGGWWKWKLDPLTIDAVMIYAQAGLGQARDALHRFHLRRARRGCAGALHQGLLRPDRRRIPRDHGLGPQEHHRPFRPGARGQTQHVFEIAFEGIQASPRHKSGVALRFPRMARWRRDKPVSEANTLDDLKAMLAQYG